MTSEGNKGSSGGESFFQGRCLRKNGLQSACYNIFISVGTFVEEHKSRRWMAAKEGTACK